MKYYGNSSRADICGRTVTEMDRHV